MGTYSKALVLFMTLPCLALFYVGIVQPKNVISVLMHHFAIACVCSIIWVIIGYSIAFAEGNAIFGSFLKRQSIMDCLFTYLRSIL